MTYSVVNGVVCRTSPVETAILQRRRRKNEATPKYEISLRASNAEKNRKFKEN